MKVRMRTLAAGPGGTWPAGAVVEVPEEVGLALIQGDYTEAVEPVRETAAVEPPERAVTRQEARPRRGKRR